MTELCLPMPVEEEGHLALRVNSGMLNKYLLQIPGYTNVSIGDFASTLDLGFFTPTMEALYQTEVEVNVLDGEGREEVNKIVAGREETLGCLLSAWEALLAQKGLAERGCTVYFNATKENRGFWCSEIEVGNRHSIESNTIALQREGDFPMVTIHTHPKASLPSPADYWMLLDNGEGDRLVPGIMVLLPDCQVLALATVETPLLSEEVFDNYVSFWDKEVFALQEKRVVFDERINKLLEMMVTAGIESQNETFRLVDEVGQKIQRGELTAIEGEEILKKASSRIMGAYQRYLKKARRICDRNEENWSKYLYRSTNAILIACARSIQVKLYISGDMKNFSEFSA